MQTGRITWTIAALALLGLSTGAAAQTYDYDTSGRLVRATYADGTQLTYTYDEADNLVRAATSVVAMPPPAIAAIRSAPGEVAVSWADTGAPNGYVLERRVAGSTQWGGVATLAAGVTSYVDRNVSAGIVYEYRVAARNGAGQSAFTVSAQAKVFGAPTVYEGGAVNGASFGQNQPVSPGSIVSIFGSALGFTVSGDTLTPFTASAPAIPLPTTLNGVSVLFDGVLAPLFFVGGQPPQQGPGGSLLYNGQINAQVPWELAGKGLVELVVRSNTGNGDLESDPIFVQVAPVSPAVFTFDFGSGRAAALNVKLQPNDGVINNSVVQPEGAFPGRESQPAPIGGIITVYCNGLGPVTPDVQSGQNSLDALRRTVDPVKVFIGGIEATVDFAGLSPQFVGLYQINVFIPQGVQTGPAVPIVIEAGGVRSRPDVTIALRNP